MLGIRRYDLCAFRLPETPSLEWRRDRSSICGDAPPLEGYSRVVVPALGHALSSRESDVADWVISPDSVLVPSDNPSIQRVVLSFAPTHGGILTHLKTDQLSSDLPLSELKTIYTDLTDTPIVPKR